MNLDLIIEDGGLRSHDVNDVLAIKIGNVEDGHVVPARGTTIRSVPPSGIVSVAVNTIKRFEDVFVSNEVVVFGYPNSIGLRHKPQIDYTRPLLRKGIVAGTNARETGTNRGPEADDEHPEGSLSWTWTCPRCGEDVESQFSECWNCGSERPPESAV